MHNQLDLRASKFSRLRKGIIVGWARSILLVLLDVGAIASAWLLATKYGTPTGQTWDIIDDPSALIVILAINIGIFTARGLYKGGYYRRDYLGISKALFLAAALTLLIAFLGDPENYLSRSKFLLSLILSIIFVSACRLFFDIATQLVRERGAVRYPVFIISDPATRERDIGLVEGENRYTLLGIADASALDNDRRDELLEQLFKLRIVEVFISWQAIEKRQHLCWYFQRAGITLRILFPTLRSPFPQSGLYIIGGVPSLTVQASPIVGSEYLIKRYFDFCFALILLTVFSPLYLIISLLIRFDSPGPVFFRQTRVGLHRQSFKVWKFRTMVTDADKLQSTLEARNEMKDGILFKMKDDPRITKIGGFLRRYSLDELPQLFNVLMGEMSFVGPRPLPVRDVEKFEERHFIRQEVLPGITGLWQVSGRSDIDDFESVLNLDLSYIANWALWLDVKILRETVKVVLRGTGSY